MSTSLSSSSKFLSPSQERNFRLSLDVPSHGEKDVEKSENDSPTKSIVWVSKEFLSIVSPVFRRMIQGDCDQKDGLSPSPEPIHLSEEKMDDFLTFLECLYPYPDQKTIDRKNFFLVLLLSYKYEIRCLVEKCDKIYKEIYQAENYRVGNEGILNRLSFLVEYNLIETIKMIVPYVAALDTKVLEKYRMENISSIPGNHWFYLAVYEAKFQRKMHEEHEPEGYGYAESACAKCSKKDKKCKKCWVVVCTTCKLDKCKKFHHPLDETSCLCGYDFSTQFLA